MSGKQDGSPIADSRISAFIAGSRSTRTDHTMEVRSDGTLWGCGCNWSGELGIGSRTSSNDPVRVGRDDDWASASAGDNHTLAIKKDGTLWAWGGNNAGQLGNGGVNDCHGPVQLGKAKWALVSAGNQRSVAVATDGTLWEWGFCGEKRGDAKFSFVRSPTQVLPGEVWKEADPWKLIEEECEREIRKRELAWQPSTTVSDNDSLYGSERNSHDRMIEAQAFRARIKSEVWDHFFPQRPTA